MKTNTRIRKLAEGTYWVRFSETNAYTVIIPKFWLALGDEELNRSVAIEMAAEELPCMDCEKPTRECLCGK